jgi:hypothetical protein
MGAAHPALFRTSHPAGCSATMKKWVRGAGRGAPRTAPVMLRDGAFKKRVRCGARRGQGAVPLKIVKVRDAMSKVRRTQFFNEWLYIKYSSSVQIKLLNF